MPVSVSGSVARLPRRERACDRAEVRRAGRAVDQRQAVEQRRRADRADDQVLQPRLQRVLAAAARSRTARTAGSRAARCRRTAIPCSGRRQQRHAADRRQQQRVELAVRGFPGGAASATPAAPCTRRRRSGSGSAPATRSSIRSAPETIDLLRAPLPDRQAERRAERHQAESGHDLPRARSASRAGRPAARSPRRPAARSAARARRSRRAGLSGGRWRGARVMGWRRHSSSCGAMALSARAAGRRRRGRVEVASVRALGRARAPAPATAALTEPSLRCSASCG